MDTPINEAIKAVGGQGAMARLLNVSRGLVSQWSKGRRPVAAHHVLPIEKASGVSRHRLNASVFGPGPSANEDASRDELPAAPDQAPDPGAGRIIGVDAA